MESAASHSSEGGASGSLSSHTGLPEHCVQLTKEQYETLLNLQNDPFFNKLTLTPSSSSSSSSSTPWEELLASKTPHNQCLVWRVHHYWLGSLRFALLSKSVEGGENLYRDIHAVYEDLLSNFENDATLLFPPRTRRLVFDHVGRGVFHLRLTGCEVREGKQVAVGKPPAVTSEEECRRKVRVLASEATHAARGSPWPKVCRNLYEHAVGLPLTLLEGDGVEFSPEGLEEATVGPESAAYRHELRRTVAYVAEKMEDRGEQIDWDYLYVGAITEDHPKNFLSSLSKSVEDFIEAHIPQT